MSKIEMTTEDLWDEVRKELSPDIPWNRAKTISQYMSEINDTLPDNAPEIGENFVRKTLDNKAKNEGWGRRVYKGITYYWPPEENSE